MQAVNLTKLLEGTDFNRASLARELKISPQAIYQWACVPPEWLPKVAKLTGLSIEKLNPEYAKALRGAA